MRIGLVQMDICWENKTVNLTRAEVFFQQAVREEVDLLVFPEMSMTGFTMNSISMAEQRDESVVLETVKSLAKRYKIACGVGYIKAVEEGQLPFNTYVLVDENGENLLEYDKIHPFSYADEDQHYQAGGHIPVIRYRGIKIACLVCYDLRFPELFQYASREAQLIMVPANWPASRSMHWNSLLRARAIENQCYLAGVNRTGSGGSLVYAGESSVYGPDGSEVMKAGGEEGLYVCEIDAAFVERERERFPIKQDRRVELYCEIYRK